MVCYRTYTQTYTNKSIKKTTVKRDSGVLHLEFRTLYKNTRFTHFKHAMGQLFWGSTSLLRLHFTVLRPINSFKLNKMYTYRLKNCLQKSNQQGTTNAIIYNW